jgi:hypothetical protein
VYQAFRLEQQLLSPILLTDVITSGKVFFDIADPLLFCHPVRDRLTLNRWDHFEAKGFLTE